ncbi:MAG: GNAT family N-acetyltransferase [Myxococcales bacterium]|nr:GNAT family N-acetyltransferase [Myxococcales bacterium]
MILQTERLTIRRLTDGDVDALFTVYGDAEAMRWVDDGQPIPFEDCGRWIEITLRNYATRGYGMFALELRHTPGVCGFMGLVHPGSQPDAELKYALRREVWGQGLATEAAAALLQYGTTTFGLTRIIATIAPQNLASRRVLLKVGMQPEGIVTHDDGSQTETLAWDAGARG